MDVECNFLGIFRILLYYVKLTHVLIKRQLESQLGQMGKEVVKVGDYIVSVDRKTTKYRLEAYEIAFFENPCQAVHSNVFPYFPDLPVSSCL